MYNNTISNINATPSASNLGTFISSMNGTPATSLQFNTSMETQCTIRLTKAENGGFVILVQTNETVENGFTFKPPKVYINHNTENLGKDIQNALLLELMKA